MQRTVLPRVLYKDCVAGSILPTYIQYAYAENMDPDVEDQKSPLLPRPRIEDSHTSPEKR